MAIRRRRPLHLPNGEGFEAVPFKEAVKFEKL
jgi:hypothetical protein